MTTKIIHKTFAAKAGDDPLEYVMSDGSVDRMGDVIEPSGWDLKDFVRNPIALFNHNKDLFVGNWTDVRIEKGQLRGRLQLMDAVSERLKEIHAAVKGGVLRAVSVGFSAVEAEPFKNGGMRFKKQALVECSLVAVGANTNALQMAKSLSLSGETMAMIFDKKAFLDDLVLEPEFLKLKAADEWSPDQARQAKIWLAGLMKDYPFNPLYRKLHRLMDEIETVRTLGSIVRAKIGIK